MKKCDNQSSHRTRSKNAIIKWGHETEIVPVSWLWKPFIPYSNVTIIEGDGED